MCYEKQSRQRLSRNVALPGDTVICANKQCGKLRFGTHAIPQLCDAHRDMHIEDDSRVILPCPSLSNISINLHQSTQLA